MNIFTLFSTDKLLTSGFLYPTQACYSFSQYSRTSAILEWLDYQICIQWEERYLTFKIAKLCRHFLYFRFGLSRNVLRFSYVGGIVLDLAILKSSSGFLQHTSCSCASRYRGCNRQPSLYCRCISKPPIKLDLAPKYTGSLCYIEISIFSFQRTAVFVSRRVTSSDCG